MYDSPTVICADSTWGHVVFCSSHDSLNNLGDWFVKVWIPSLISDERRCSPRLYSTRNNKHSGGMYFDIDSLIWLDFQVARRWVGMKKSWVLIGCLCGCHLLLMWKTFILLCAKCPALSMNPQRVPESRATGWEPQLNILTKLIDKHLKSFSTRFPCLMAYGTSTRMREGLIHRAREGPVLGRPWKEAEGLTEPV